MSKWRIFKRVTLLVTLIINLVSLFTNWLLYADIANIEPGLVFGPYPTEFKYTVLGLCVLSSFVNFMEVHSIYVELFRKENRCWLGGNTTSAMVIWLDDLPKAGIMLYIVMCHDRAISIVEVVRACLLLATLTIRLLAFIIRETCVRRLREESTLPTREEVMYRQRRCRGAHFGFISLGLSLKLTAFLVLYFLTFFKTYPGGVTYKRPKGIFEPPTSAGRFIANSSLFAQAEPRGPWVELLALSAVVAHRNCSAELRLGPKGTVVRSRCGLGPEEARTVSRAPAGAGGEERWAKFAFQYLEPSRSLLLGNVEFALEAQGLSEEALEVRYFCRGSNPAQGDVMGLWLGMLSKAEVAYNGTVPAGGGPPIVAARHCWRTGKMRCRMSGLPGPSKVRGLTPLAP